MGRLTLNPSDSIGISSAPASSNLQILGSGGSKETVTIAAGVVATFSSFGGDGDTIILAGNANDYTATRDGSRIILTTLGGTSLTVPAVPAGTTIQFADATRQLVLNTGTSSVDLGTQSFTTSGQTATVTAGTNGNTPIVGQTFNLTTAADTVTGTANDDTINGNTAGTWSVFDAIDGGAGTDTLNVLDSGTGAGSAPAGATVVNVEKLNINTTTAGYTIDASGYTGLTTFNLTDAGQGAIKATLPTTAGGLISATGTSTVEVIGGGGTLKVAAGTGQIDIGSKSAVANSFTSVQVAGGDGINISNNGSAAGNGTTLTTVTLSGYAGAATINAKGLATLNVTGAPGAISTNTTAALTANFSGNTAAAAFTANTASSLVVNNNGGTVAAGGSINAAAATSVNITNSGTVQGVTVNAAAATGVTVNSTGAFTLTDLVAAAATSLSISNSAATTITNISSAAALTSITLSGAGAATIGALGGVGALTSINASGNTGGVTVTPTLGNAVQFTGGSGADNITLTATTRAIDLGGGDDKVTLTLTAGDIGTGGSINGGTGTDTLVLSAADASSAVAGLSAKIVNFERLSLTGADTQTVDVSKLGNISYVSEAGAGNALTINNLVNNGTFAFTDASVATTVNIKDAVTGANDVLNVVVTGGAAIAAGTLTASNVETININSDDTAANPAGGFAHTLTLNAASASALTVTGDAGLTLTLAAGTGPSTINTSGVTRGAVSLATVADTNVTFTGGATDTTFSAASIVTGTKVASITTGAGNDTLTGGAGNDVINAGNGNNSINGGAGNNTLTGGSGNDTITAADGNNTVNAGDGTNTITTGSGVDNITGGSGVDVIKAGAGNDIIVGGGGADQITGGAGADRITISGNTSTIIIAAGGDTGVSTATTNTQTSILTGGFDVVSGAVAGTKLDLTALGYTGGALGLTTANAANLQGADNQVIVVRGTYDAAAGTFTYAANGADTALTYDANTTAGTDFHTLIFTGFTVGATSTISTTGLVTFA